MASTPEDQEIRLSKVDLWWILAPARGGAGAVVKFLLFDANPPGAGTRIVVPSALQMGWAESPAYFCPATERDRDLIDTFLREGVELPEHPLEQLMKPKDLRKTTPLQEQKRERRFESV